MRGNYRAVQYIQPAFIFPRAKRQSPQRLAVVEARLLLVFEPGCRASQILKNSDTHMRLLRAFIDWIRRRRRPEQETIQHSADDPWVLQQIEKFERELKR